jgi:hypothetical protein
MQSAFGIPVLTSKSNQGRFVDAKSGPKMSINLTNRNERQQRFKEMLPVSVVSKRESEMVQKCSFHCFLPRFIRTL